ncbi:MAG: nicotinamide mononucleotide transporter family protein [Pseudomonadota bacterium]|nr:nicotinamide mononucleotide transporter family protein [Pseudomonadota bacterium]MEC8978387.1 nicotinamide mononucleotide transporter family protein [Pseudomonadota bacterium]
MFYYDLFSAAIRLLSVILLVMNSPYNWVVASFACMMSFYNFWCMQFYAKSMMHLAKIFVQFYGWLKWQDLDKQHPHRTYRTSWHDFRKAYLYLFIIGLWLTYYLAPFGPYFMQKPQEILLIALNCLSLWLSTHRKIENWYTWCFYNVINAYVYISHGFIANGMVSICYLALSLQGYLNWLEYLQPEVETSKI